MGQERVVASYVKHENSMWRRNAEEIFSEGLWKSGERVNAAVICTCDPDPVGVNGDRGNAEWRNWERDGLQEAGYTAA